MSSKEQCPLCSNASNDEMVQCDKCDQWIHFVCAGVTRDIAFEDYDCVKCRRQQQNDNTLIESSSVCDRNAPLNKQHDENRSKATSVVSKDSLSQIRNKKLALARIDEERKVQMKFIQQKYQILLEDESCNEQSDKSTVQSVKSRTNEWVQRTMQEQQIKPQGLGLNMNKVQRDLHRATCMESNNEIQRDMHRTHANQSFVASERYDLQRKLDINESHNGQLLNNNAEHRGMHRSKIVTTTTQRDMQRDYELDTNTQREMQRDYELDENFQKQGIVHSDMHCTTNMKVSNETQRGLHSAHAYIHYETLKCARPPDVFKLQRESQTVGLGLSNSKCEPIVGEAANQQCTQQFKHDHVKLTENNIHARQVISHELPKFSGNPTEWPLFLSQFENSSRMCGFTNEENMLRLQKSLKGKALEYVGSQLMIPELVPQVMATLRMVFGRPEIIINTLLAKLRSSAAVNTNRLDTIITFALEVKNITATMKASGLHAHLNSPTLMQELIEKLPPQLRLNWALFARTRTDVNLVTFSDWLYATAEAASDVTYVTVPFQATDAEKRKTERVSFQKEERMVSDLKCPICDQKHEVPFCKKFNDTDYKERWNFVRGFQLCRTCLKQHDLRYCPDRRECGINECKAKHHPLLHKSNEVPAVVASQYSKSSNVLYKVIPVTIYGERKSIHTFAFLDDGSGPTLIEYDVLKKLNINGPTSSLSLKWTDGTVRVEEDSYIVDLKVSSESNPSQKITLSNVRTVRGLDLPTQTLNMDELRAKFKHLRGLPITSYNKAKPTMIIGLNNIRAAMPLKYREGKQHEPAAAKTRLGWTVFGIQGSTCSDEVLTGYSDSILRLHISECDDVALDKLVSEQMKLEDAFFENNPHTKFTPENYPVLQQKIKRKGNMFVANLLWKQETLRMPENFKLALRRLEGFESRLLRDAELQLQVQQKISQMEDKGYIRKLSDSEICADHERKWYLPIFVVKNANKPKKIRIVWDAAAEYKGISLNACLQKGPDLLTPLINVLFNFRIGRIALSGDICEMYHRVQIDNVDQQSQRFLWRNCEQGRPPDVYALTVMSFGASCSPSIAQFVKNVNAIEHEHVYPRAVKSIIERHYVDDMLDSVDTVEEAIDLAISVRKIHARANFEIRGWLSNSKEVLEAIGNPGIEEDFCQAGTTIDQVHKPEKVLGLWWDTERDVFTFSLKFTKAGAEIISGQQMPTKRELLRLLMSIFDPLGLINFFTVQARVILQKVWRSGVGWDDIIPEELHHEWNRWRAALPEVSQVHIPRCYFGSFNREQSKIELHIFTDASEYAYVAVGYLRIVQEDAVRVALVGSKAKVAPLRPITIPRMELLAAVLGARLGNLILEAHDVSVEATYFCSDSQTVLHWLKCDPRVFKQFVMFRVGEIQQLTNTKSWRFVPTKYNIADLATKWKQTPNFCPNNLWFSGPEFLHKREIPNIQVCNNDIKDQIGEERVAMHTEIAGALVNYKKFSKWERLHRCMAYVKKFTDLMLAIKHKPNKSKGKHKLNPVISEVQNLTSDELKWSQKFLLRTAQGDEFSKEISQLRLNSNQLLPTGSVLRKFSPYLDEYDVVRQRARIQKSSFPDKNVNPVVLPKTHYITRLLADYYHRKFNHINHETAINSIFENFRVPGLRGLMRSIRSNCAACKYASAKPETPEMGMLPQARTSVGTRPFTYVGMDFFGPITVTVGRRNEKRYGVVFTCLTSRAVHIEVAYSLTTSSCIQVVRNFIGRRGKPQVIFSDNGTNLKSADKTLREANDDVDFKRLQEAFTAPDTSWSFIPPASPHMGGVWERIVRSIKNALYKIITPSTKLSDEVLHNLLIEVESILNCRPLTYLSLDSAEQEVLTPNHLLLGSACGNKPPGVFNDRDEYFKHSWRYSQLLADRFWKRWVAEVLPDMTGRTKWFRRVRPIEVGDVCIIVDHNLPRHQWPRGIISQVFPGAEGQVRSAIVHTTHGDFHRPAAKIAILNIQSPRSTEKEQELVFPTHGHDTGGEDVANSVF